jgi:hypothetical protein
MMKLSRSNRMRNSVRRRGCPHSRRPMAISASSSRANNYEVGQSEFPSFTASRSRHATHCRKDNSRLTAVTVNPFNVIEPVEYLKGTVGSKPFEDYFTGRKNHADCDATDAAYSAYVLVSHQMK